jgi:hypothetical protein
MTGRRFIPLAAVLALAALTSCTAVKSAADWWRGPAEFAPPQSRWPVGQPSAAGAEAPPPAIRTAYCYRTLADVECFATRQPGRTGYTGSYPEE